jgi:two-component system response regulator AlgR
VSEVAFIDLRMPDIDGIALAQQLRRKLPGLDVIIVSAHHDGTLRSFEAKVTDCLLKPVRLRRLQQAIDRVSVDEAEAQEQGGSLRPEAILSVPSLVHRAPRAHSQD